MQLFYACLISLCAHLVSLFVLSWIFPAPVRLHTPIDATLRQTPTAPATLADAVASIATGDRPEPPRAIAPEAPKNLSGASLQRAQASLSKHLFYPPSAITQGLEGEVVLLLTLDTTDRIHTVEVAKSSGHALLDEAAIDAARHIGALPGNPRQTLLPVSFRLQ